jgi:hypothetical protein
MCASVDTSRTEALVERIFEATLSTLEIAAIHIGDRLGFYRSLDAQGPATSRELASATGTVERYVREWLEQQAVAGLITVADTDADATDRRYGLPASHRPIFVEENDLNYLAPLARLAIGVLAPLDELLAAYRGGAAVPYEAYGADVRAGVAELNRPQFLNLLAGWLGSIPDADARLRSRPAAHVADVACGSAWSSIAIARAYPGVVVDAIDVDPGSIEDAREALHDMTHPVQALRTARESLAPRGSVVIADERVADHFTAPGDELERFNYGWSVLHCLTVGLLDEDSAGTGTAIRAGTVRAYASAAGFTAVEELPIEHDFWRFYRLLP